MEDHSGPQEARQQPSTSAASQQSSHAEKTENPFDMVDQSMEHQSKPELPPKITRQQFLCRFELHSFQLMSQPMLEAKWCLIAAIFFLLGLILALRPASKGRFGLIAWSAVLCIWH
jgi:hypothetical protein